MNERERDASDTVDTSDRRAILALERDEDANSRSLRAWWSGMDNVAQATWVLVVVTLVFNAGLVGANIITAIAGQKAATDAHDAYARQAADSVPHIFPLVTGDNITGTLITITATSSAFAVRPYCLIRTEDAPAYIGQWNADTPTEPYANEDAALVPNGTLKMFPASGSCNRIGSPISPKNRITSVFLYFLFRSSDGTPHEAARAVKWNDSIHDWANENYAEFPQSGYALNAARKALDRDYYFSHRPADAIDE